MDSQPSATLDYVDRTRRYFADYYQRNREKKLAYARAQRALRKDELNARRRELARERGVPAQKKFDLGASGDKQEYNKKYHIEVRAEKMLREKVQALKKVSKTGAVACACCGESDIRVLTVNHINGGGRVENKRFGELRKRILNGSRSVDDLEVLCFNCNIRYEYVRGRSRLPTDWERIVQEVVGAVDD